MNRKKAQASGSGCACLMSSLTRSTGDPASIEASVFEQPVAQIYYNSLGKSGGIAFTVFAFIILQFVCFTATQALARTFFAFSRDRLIPGSSLWTKVNRWSGTPLNAVWISVFWCIAINLIALGSYTAALGVFNVCAIALDWSYCIPIACKVLFGKFEPGPWHLGKFSTPINIWACVWTAFVSVIFVFPETVPVTPQDMNWAVVYLAGILAAALLYWFISGRKFYTGPLIVSSILEIGTSQRNNMLMFCRKLRSPVRSRWMSGREPERMTRDMSCQTKRNSSRSRMAVTQEMYGSSWQTPQKSWLECSGDEQVRSQGRIGFGPKRCLPAAPAKRLQTPLFCGHVHASRPPKVAHPACLI